MLENEKKPLKAHVAEAIAASTGISAEWLIRNEPSEAPIDSKGKPYTIEHYERAQAITRLHSMPTTIKAPILVRRMFLEQYAKTRDLFLRPEMYKHFIKFVLKLDMLYRQFDLEADYPKEMTGADVIREEMNRLKPGNLFPGVIADAQRVWSAVDRERKRVEREAAQRVAAFLPPEDRGLRTIRKRIRRTATERKK